MPLTGKTGGALLPVHKGRVGIVVFDPKDFANDKDIYEKLCRGVVGQRNKMCMVDSCGSICHCMKKVDLDWQNKLHLLIKANKDRDAVYVKPPLSMSKCGDELVAYYSCEDQVKEDWEVFFLGLRNTKEEGQTEDLSMPLQHSWMTTRRLKWDLLATK